MKVYYMSRFMKMIMMTFLTKNKNYFENIKYDTNFLYVVVINPWHFFFSSIYFGIKSIKLPTKHTK